MSNFKWGIILALAAFFISVSLGLLAGVHFLHIMIRALIFTVVFFGLGFGLHLLINSYFPELLFHEDDSGADAYDSASNVGAITVDSTGEYAVPELYRTNDPNEMGNIDDLISGVFRPRGHEAPRSAPSPINNVGIDRKPEAGYNSGTSVKPPAADFSPQDTGGGNFQDTSVFNKSPADRQSFTPSFSDDDSGLGGLPDLDMMAMAFSSGYSPVLPSPAAASASSASPASFAAAPVMSFDDAEERKSGSAGSKPETLQGDFDPKELARGISTILNKDK